MIRRMTCKLDRHVPEHRWLEFLVREPGRYDNVASGRGVAIIQNQPESIVFRMNLLDRARCHIGDGMLLEPLAIGDEVFKRQETGAIEAACLRVMIER